MLRLTIVSTAQEAVLCDLSDCVVAVVDVLRATSVITTALNNGTQRVLTLTTPEAAFAIRDRLGDSQTVLGGERYTDRVEGFDLGNSPHDYCPERVYGRTVVLTTTNGTLALQNSSGARELFCLSMLNLTATAHRLASCNSNIAIVCSGNNGFFTLEDALCAALAARAIEKTGVVIDYADDRSLSIRMMADVCSASADSWLQHSLHYKRLIEKGYIADIDFCLHRADAMPIVCKARPNELYGVMEITKE